MPPLAILGNSSCFCRSFPASNRQNPPRTTVGKKGPGRQARPISSSSTTTHIYLENTTTTEFYLAASTLYQKTGSLEPVALTSNNVEVNNLEFKQVATATSTPSIQISLTINYKNPVNLPEYGASVNTTSTVSLRSY